MTTQTFRAVTIATLLVATNGCIAFTQDYPGPDVPTAARVKIMFRS